MTSHSSPRCATSPSPLEWKFSSISLFIAPVQSQHSPSPAPLILHVIKGCIEFPPSTTLSSLLFSPSSPFLFSIPLLSSPPSIHILPISSPQLSLFDISTSSFPSTEKKKDEKIHFTKNRFQRHTKGIGRGGGGRENKEEGEEVEEEEGQSEEGESSDESEYSNNETKISKKIKQNHPENQISASPTSLSPSSFTHTPISSSCQTTYDRLTHTLSITIPYSPLSSSTHILPFCTSFLIPLSPSSSSFPLPPLCTEIIPSPPSSPSPSSSPNSPSTPSFWYDMLLYSIGFSRSTSGKTSSELYQNMKMRHASGSMVNIIKAEIGEEEGVRMIEETVRKIQIGKAKENENIHIVGIEGCWKLGSVLHQKKIFGPQEFYEVEMTLEK